MPRGKQTFTSCRAKRHRLELANPGCRRLRPPYATRFLPRPESAFANCPFPRPASPRALRGRTVSCAGASAGFFRTILFKVNDSWNRSGIGWLYSEWRTTMARKSKLTRVAVGIGTAMGKADRGVQKVARAGSLAKKELDDISKQVDALKRQLQITAKRLTNALSLIGNA